MNVENSASKKILFITGFFPFRQGGAEYQAFLLANFLKKNHHIYFIFRDLWNKNDGKIKDRDWTLYPIKPIKIKGIGKTFFFEGWRLYKLIQNISPDIIYVRGANAYFGIAVKYAKKNNCKVIWHIAHDNDVHSFCLKQIKSLIFDYIDYRAVRYGIMHADYIIGQTCYQAEKLLQHYNRVCDTVIGNWHPISNDNDKKIDNYKITVLWIANWKPIKQPDIFVRLSKKIGAIGKQYVRFVMLGRNDRYEKLVKEAKKNKIEVMGEIPNDQVNKLLAQSHILINTSKQEGFSNTFIQAWMRRVPVISLNVDPDDILKNEKIGFCSGSFEQLVKDTKRLLEDTELRKSMGLKARKYAIKNHSLDNMKKITGLFSDLLVF